MNNSKTPKIVVGVGLVAIYAAGMAVFALRGKQDSVVAQSPPAAVSAAMAAAPAMPPLVVPESADTPAPAAMSAPVVPPVASETQAPPAPRPAVASQPRPRAEEVPVDSLPSPRPPAASDVEELSRSNSGSNAVSDLATTQSAPDESVTSAEETSDEDSLGTETEAVDNSDQ